MRVVKSFNDVTVALKDINDKLDSLRVRNLDAKGARVVNAGASEKPTDCVIKQELDELVSQIGSNSNESGLAKRVKVLEQKVACLQSQTANIYNIQLPAIWTALDSLVTAINAIGIEPDGEGGYIMTGGGGASIDEMPAPVVCA